MHVSEPGRVLKFQIPRTVWVLIDSINNLAGSFTSEQLIESWMIFKLSLAPRKNRMDAIEEIKDTPQFFFEGKS